MRLSEIYLQHDISKERKAIAIERAQARVAEAEAQNNQPSEPSPAINNGPQSREDAERAAKLFLEQLRKEGDQANE